MMNPFLMKSSLDLVFEFVFRYGASTVWQITPTIPQMIGNDILAKIPMVEATLNFARRLKWVVMEDPMTGLTQGPYLREKVKIPKGENELPTL